MRLLIVLFCFLVFPAFADVASVEHVAARDAQAVHKTGDETIGGKKTFSSIPMIPTAELPTVTK